MMQGIAFPSADHQSMFWKHEGEKRTRIWEKISTRDTKRYKKILHEELWPQNEYVLECGKKWEIVSEISDQITGFF